jgi:enterochelin esterase family protein
VEVDRIDEVLFIPESAGDVLANERMAKALAAKGYHYQFVFTRNAAHVDLVVRQQTLSEALHYIWRDYTASTVSL